MNRRSESAVFNPAYTSVRLRYWQTLRVQAGSQSRRYWGVATGLQTVANEKYHQFETLKLSAF